MQSCFTYVNVSHCWLQLREVYTSQINDLFCTLAFHHWSKNPSSCLSDGLSMCAMSKSMFPHGGKLRWEQSSSAPFVGSLGHRSFPTEAGDLQGGASHWCIDQDICTKHAMFSCQFLANHPQTFQWKFWVQWTTIFRRKVFAQPGNRTQDLLQFRQVL